jgi:hypothetical protein
VARRERAAKDRARFVGARVAVGTVGPPHGAAARSTAVSAGSSAQRLRALAPRTDA